MNLLSCMYYCIPINNPIYYYFIKIEHCGLNFNITKVFRVHASFVSDFVGSLSNVRFYLFWDAKRFPFTVIFINICNAHTNVVIDKIIIVLEEKTQDYQ